MLDCGPGVPLAKCNASLFSPDPAVTFVPNEEPIPTAAPPDAETCGVTFFDDHQLAKLTNWFGTISCFRFVGSATWLVVGDGMSLTAAVEEATPGGAIVASLTCQTGDDKCLSADAAHDFAAFEVTYPPKPSSGRTQVQFTERQRFVMIYNGYCGLFAVDTETMTWHPPTATIRDEIVDGKADVPTVNVPALVSGAEALNQKAPTATDDCQAPVQ